MGGFMKKGLNVNVKDAKNVMNAVSVSVRVWEAVFRSSTVFCRTYQRTTDLRAWLQSNVQCWRTPWRWSSSTSTRAATGSRCRTWTSRKSWSRCSTLSPCTPRPPTPSSRTLSPRKPAKVLTSLPVCLSSHPNHDHNHEWHQCSCSSGQRKGHDSIFGKKGKREKCLFSPSEKWEFELKFNCPAFSSFYQLHTHLKPFLLGNKWTLDCFDNFFHTFMHLHPHKNFSAKSLFWLHSY